MAAAPAEAVPAAGAASPSGVAAAPDQAVAAVGAASPSGVAAAPDEAAPAAGEDAVASFRLRDARGDWQGAVERLAAGARPFALLAVEVDDAPRLAAADAQGAAEALARVEQAVRDELRPGDVLGREEDGRLWVVAADLGAAGARALAERLADAVAAVQPPRGAPLDRLDRVGGRVRPAAPTATSSPRAPTSRSTRRGRRGCRSPERLRSRFVWCVSLALYVVRGASEQHHRGKGGGRRFGARVVVLTSVCLGGAIARVSQQSFGDARGVVALYRTYGDRIESGHPLGPPRGRCCEDALEVRRNSAPGPSAKSSARSGGAATRFGPPLLPSPRCGSKRRAAPETPRGGPLRPYGVSVGVTPPVPAKGDGAGTGGSMKAPRWGTTPTVLVSVMPTAWATAEVRS